MWKIRNGNCNVNVFERPCDKGSCQTSVTPLGLHKMCQNFLHLTGKVQLTTAAVTTVRFIVATRADFFLFLDLQIQNNDHWYFCMEKEFSRWKWKLSIRCVVVLLMVQTIFAHVRQRKNSLRSSIFVWSQFQASRVSNSRLRIPHNSKEMASKPFQIVRVAL